MRIGVGGWLLALVFTAAGFAALIGLPSLWPAPVALWLGTALFVALPLIGLRIAAGRHWTALFQRPSLRDVVVGLSVTLLCLVTSAIVGLVVVKTSITTGNPAVAALAHAGPAEVALFFARTAPQLLGEELVTIIPFLAVLTLLHAAKAPRWVAVGGAWIATAVLFAALHLPTYGWNLVQAVTVIGTARMALTLAYVLTKNVWVSTIAHVANDWLLFSLVLALSALHAT